MERALIISRLNGWFWKLAILSGLLFLLYYSVLSDLVMRWWEDPDYSHGFLVPLVSAYFVWRARKKLTQLPVLPDRRGLLLLWAGIGILILGNIGQVTVLERSSLIFVMAGLIVYLLGWGFLKQLLFPVGFLIFMIPLPSMIFDPVAFRLQLFAAKAATFCLQTLQIPILREGSLIYLTASIMDVTEACSGIRSLMSLMALGTVLAYITQEENWKRAVLIAFTIPIVILANALRVTGTGILADFFGEEMAQGFYHNFSGWLVFVLAFGLLLAIGMTLNKVSDLTITAKNLKP